MINEKLSQEWQIRVKQFKESGQTMKVWCEEQGFKVHQLKYWNYKFRNIDDTIDEIKWIPVKLYEKNQGLPQTQDDSLKIMIGKFSLNI